MPKKKRKKKRIIRQEGTGQIFYQMRQDGETAFMQFRSLVATTVFSVTQTNSQVQIGFNTDIIDVDENNNVIIKNSLRVDSTQSLLIGSGTQNAVLGFASTTGNDFTIRDSSNTAIFSILEPKEIPLCTQ